MNFAARFPTVYGQPLATARFKFQPQDFIVEETLSFPLSGQGEHLYLYIQKHNANTEWVCKRLARQLGIPQRDIGYAGLKDRHAVTSQWFSVPARFASEEKLHALEDEEIKLCERVYHERKLRRGAIKHNRFRLVLRDVSLDAEQLQQRIDQVTNQGVPNYFDEQRFGRQRGNLAAAQQMFRRMLKPTRFQRGIYLSAARSWIFNQILAERILRQNWCSPLVGEVCWLAGTKRFFSAIEADQEIQKRLNTADIHLTGALWGKGKLQSSDAVAQLEQSVSQAWLELSQGLTAAGLEQDRRPLRIIPGEFAYRLDTDLCVLNLEFTLPAGAYATAVLRELVDLKTISDG